jgi:gliding motility associated protien GldN
MKYLVIISSLFLFTNLYSQDDSWGSGWGDDSGWGSESGGSPSDDAGAEGFVARPASVSAELKIPVIGTHYDDDPVAHYDPTYVENDGNLRTIQGVVIKRPPLREADVKMRRRVWRIIDTRQKMNLCWSWPKQPVTQVFWDLALKGLVKAYTSDSLTTILTPEDIIRKTAKEMTVQLPVPGYEDEFYDSGYYLNVKWEDIKKFEIMEEWVFDYKHGDWRPIIVAIAPIVPVEVLGREYDSKPFWIKMDDCRPTLAKCDVYNRYNDAMRLNWDQQINTLRLFDSYIVKTTDWDDRYINQKPEFMQDPLAALLQGEQVKNDLFIFEHDLWEY